MNLRRLAVTRSQISAQSHKEHYDLLLIVASPRAMITLTFGVIWNAATRSHPLALAEHRAPVPKFPETEHHRLWRHIVSRF